MKSFLLRLDDGLHNLVRVEAERSRRSMQAVVLVALEEFLKKGQESVPQAARREVPAATPEPEVKSEPIRSFSKEQQAKGRR